MTYRAIVLYSKEIYVSVEDGKQVTATATALPSAIDHDHVLCVLNDTTISLVITKEKPEGLVAFDPNEKTDLYLEIALKIFSAQKVFSAIHELHRDDKESSALISLVCGVFSKKLKEPIDLEI